MLLCLLVVVVGFLGREGNHHRNTFRQTTPHITRHADNEPARVTDNEAAKHGLLKNNLQTENSSNSNGEKNMKLQDINVPCSEIRKRAKLPGETTYKQRTAQTVI